MPADRESRLLYRLDPFPAHDFSRGFRDQMTPRRTVSTVSHYPTAISRLLPVVRGPWSVVRGGVAKRRRALPVLPPLFLREGTTRSVWGELSQGTSRKCLG